MHVFDAVGVPVRAFYRIPTHPDHVGASLHFCSLGTRALPLVAPPSRLAPLNLDQHRQHGAPTVFGASHDCATGRTYLRARCGWKARHLGYKEDLRKSWTIADTRRRKTGVTVPDSGVRDEHGMEPIENLFSSPGKSDHEDEQEEGSDDYGSGEEAMDITTSTGLRRTQHKTLGSLTWLQHLESVQRHYSTVTGIGCLCRCHASGRRGRRSSTHRLNVTGFWRATRRRQLAVPPIEPTVLNPAASQRAVRPPPSAGLTSRVSQMEAHIRYHNHRLAATACAHYRMMTTRRKTGAKTVMEGRTTKSMSLSRSLWPC